MMHAFYEKDIDYDYIEIILTEDEIDQLINKKGINKDFIDGVRNKIPLNIFIREQTISEKIDEELNQGEESCL